MMERRIHHPFDVTIPAEMKIAMQVCRYVTDTVTVNCGGKRMIES